MTAVSFVKQIIEKLFHLCFLEGFEVESDFISSWDITQDLLEEFTDGGQHQLVGEDDAVLTDDGSVTHVSAVTVEFIP